MTTRSLARSLPVVFGLTAGVVAVRHWWEGPCQHVRQVTPQLPGSRGLLPTKVGPVGFRIRRRGEGTPVVLVHGWGGCADVTWWKVLQHLPAPFLAVDLPGHGASQLEGCFSISRAADCVVDLVDALGFRDALLVGYSLGGPVALEATHRAKDRFSGIVGLATSAHWSFARAQLAATLGPYLFGASSPVSKLSYRRRVQSCPDLACYEAWSLSAAPRRKILLQASSDLRHFDARTWVSVLDRPTAWVITAKDKVMPPERQRETAAMIGGPAFEIDSGHACSQVAAPQVASALTAASGELGMSS
ncbi:MAG: alpha/beta fold hydrolase [Acidimicrobiia bacterium]